MLFIKLSHKTFILAGGSRQLYTQKLAIGGSFACYLLQYAYEVDARVAYMPHRPASLGHFVCLVKLMIPSEFSRGSTASPSPVHSLRQS